MKLLTQYTIQLGLADEHKADVRPLGCSYGQLYGFLGFFLLCEAMIAMKHVCCCTQ